MREKTLKVQAKLNQKVDEYQPLCYMTRARELQVTACDDLRAFRREISETKREAQEGNEEGAANAFLAFENIIDTLVSELEMWIALKDDDPNLAWENLVDAEFGAVHAVRAHPVAQHIGEYVKRLNVLEHILFPPQVFVSPGMIIGDAECSICHSRYGECEHVKGRAYMGEFCGRILKDITFTEVSMVDEPVDKRCRVLSFSRDGKTMIDRMTHRVVGSIKEEEDQSSCVPLAIDDILDRNAPEDE